MSTRNPARSAATGPPPTASAASSIRRQRPPSALRGAPGSRGRAAAAAKAHVSVSLVFAHGDAQIPGSNVGAEGSSASEEALSRQLDRDTAGERMSLRSRRSSVATITSMRTDYTSSHPLSVALPEEDEPVAGPSRSPHPPRPDPTSSEALPDPNQQEEERNPDDPPTPRIRRRRASSRSRRAYPQPERDAASERRPSACEMDGEGAERASTPQTRLNPKQSGAWLRWNSPAPSFPRKDKGKAREVSPSQASQVAAKSEATETPDVDMKRKSVDLHPSTPSVPAPPPESTTSVPEEEQTVSTSNPSHPQPPSTPSPKPPMDEDPPKPPEDRTPEPQKSSTRPPEPPKSATSGWRYYFWGSGSGGGGDGSSTPSSHPAPSHPAPSHLAPPTSMADPTMAGAELALSKVESRASGVTNGSANGSAKRRTVEGATSGAGASVASAQADHVATPSAPPSPRTPIAADTTPCAAPSKAAPSSKSAAPKTSTTSKVRPPSKTPAASKTATASKGTDTAPAKEKDQPSSSINALSAPPPVEGSLLPPAEISSTPSPAAPGEAKVEPDSTAAPTSTAAPASNTATGSTAAAPAQGWGSYLASWVYPAAPATTPAAAQKDAPETTKAQPENPEATVVEPTSPVEDQRPVSESKPAPQNKQGEPAPEASDMIAEQAEAQRSAEEAQRAPSPSQPQSKLGASSASTSGWLSYLAFRASQKQITASTRTLDGGRRSGETAREEVMDFEGDPDFPSATDASTSKPAGPALSREASRSKATGGHSRQASLSKAGPSGRGASAKAPDASRQASVSGAPGKGVDTQSAATKGSGKGQGDELSPVDRRDSVVAGSTKSQPVQKMTHKRSQNLAPLSRRASNASSTRSAASTPVPASPKHNGSGHGTAKSSDLPAPPKPAAKQPNFIIPTFDITFDRPPRSLLPRNAEPAGATGLALRAFNYVYNTQPVDPPEEKRGKKAGRDVGANLPRRVGLGGGSPEDGWKDVRRVVVVGVHGWFPAKMLTSVIGEPTGTSTKFANMMGEAVKKFFAAKGVDDKEIRLTLIPLEGEGTIESRVDKLYKQYLSNPAWINDLRRADAIFFAAHSQGCIVTTHLISRMIAQGHIRTSLNREAVTRCEWAFGPIGIVPSEDSKKGRQLMAQMSGHDGGRQKVAMLAMCGVHLGPFYSISTSSVIQPYLQWFENAAARELFEFQDSTSAVSVAYQRALAMILENEVRILLLSSLNDQVVPIYGASFATASHPLLLRALYVDGASYSASDFMTNLLCFAFMLRNAGIDDQRLIEHLSEATAGSLTGVGHSTPYEELGCYSLAVQYLFHAAPVEGKPLPPLEIEPFAARDARNDFELPWIMRALVDSPEVKDLFPDELKTLKENILAWKPQTKALKEIKKRLEPMAGRQRLSPLSQLAKSGSATSLASMNSPAAPSTPAPGVQPGSAHAQSHANQSKKKPAPKAVMTMVGR